MGAQTWVRDAKRGGGKSFVSGGVAAKPPPAKRQKLVWQRTAEFAPSDAGTSNPPQSNDTDRDDPPAKATHAAAKQQTTPSEQAAKAKAKELERLRQQIEAKKRTIQQNTESAKAAAINLQKKEEEEREQRRKKLEAGFSSAFAAAKEAADADIAASKSVISFADEVEVDRVLAAGTDYGVLLLAPGASAAAIRKRYRAMAVRLHPDKCKAPRAAEAFNRLVLAYQQISKYAG
jgi:flagellar biosynthesis GTPase FlhF